MSDLTLSHTLTAGTSENVNDVQDNFDDILAWSADLDETNLSATSGLFRAYRLIEQAQGMVIGSANAGPGTFYFAVGSTTLNTSGLSQGGAPQGIYFDDADYTMSGMTQKLRVRAQCLVNGFAPGITLTVGLYPISGASGGSAGFVSATLGAVVGGSTVAFASPSANSRNQGNSGDFSIPADGYYVLGVALSGAQAASTGTALMAQLQSRWV